MYHCKAHSFINKTHMYTAHTHAHTFSSVIKLLSVQKQNIWHQRVEQSMKGHIYKFANVVVNENLLVFKLKLHNKFAGENLF